ncbi:Beta-barrel assembly-enhancing protease [bacterium HR30]|nr:Beta-barrel assembly-enhancing protease [bacterium HR30]
MLFAAATVLALSGCPRPHVEPFVGVPAPQTPEERKLWEKAEELSQTLQKRMVLRADADLDHYLRAVTLRLLPFFHLESQSVAIGVIRDPFLNAFVLPNGKLFVSEGLLAQLDSEGELACVLGHEITHFAERHAYAQSLHDQRAVSTVRSVFAVLLYGSGGLAILLPGPSLVFELLGGPHASLLLWQVRGFARELEYEADRRAWEAVRAAGYDGAACLEAMQRLLQEEQQLAAERLVEEPYFYGNHPATTDRLQRVQAWQQMNTTGSTASPARSSDSTYHEHTATVRLEVAATNMKLRRFERARFLIDQHIRALPNRPDGYVALGDWHRRHTRERNLEAAAEAYAHALALDARFAPAHREAGLLCREQGNLACARKHLTRYVELAPEALDRAIVQGILEEIEQSSR